MWTRKELKNQGKAALSRNYWKAVLVSAVYAAYIVGSSVSTTAGNNAGSTVPADLPTEAVSFLACIGAGVVIAALACIVLSRVFILNPFEVGIMKFRVNAIKGEGKISDLGGGFDNGYMRNTKTMFFRDLYVILWSCLFLIPGIIKAYEYYMIPYILADNPDMDKKEVFARSKAMMKGNKWKAFVLDLSFILWGLLGLVTCGIANVLYVDPYKQLTEAALYIKLKEE